MPNWTSMIEVAEEFGLNAPPYDLILIKQELTQKRNSIHPDKSRGSFQSDQHEKIYLRLDEAIKFIDEQISVQSSLIPVSQIPMLIEVIKKSLTTPYINQSVEDITNAEATFQITHQRRVSNNLQVPRITTAILSAVFVSIFTFWDKVKENPVLSPLANSEQGRKIWIYAFIFSGGLFIYTWWYERLTQAYIEFCLSDDGLVYIHNQIMNLLRVRSINKSGAEKALMFSKRDVISIFQNNHLEELYKSIKNHSIEHRKNLSQIYKEKIKSRKRNEEIRIARRRAGREAARAAGVGGDVQEIKNTIEEETPESEIHANYLRKNREENEKYKEDFRQNMAVDLFGGTASSPVIINFIGKINIKLLKRYYPHKNLSLKDSDECTKITLAKLIQRGVIQKIERKDIDDWYQIITTSEN